ncbi:MAG: hypothetical protein KDC98_05250, partial [Planctomycetes bacterium]|nr:hypothetical protein [Planctomycetota bacterium]
AVHWPRGWARTAALLLLLGIGNPGGTLINQPFWRGELSTKESIALYVTPYDHGICDERAFYYPTCGLSRWPWLDRMPAHSYREQGEQCRAKAAEAASKRGPDESRLMGVIRGNIGFFGFYAGPDADIVDPLALSDAFLARQPPLQRSSRIGHIRRDVPNDYLASRSAESSRFSDPATGELFDRLVLLTRGPLFDAERLRLIWAMNLP